MIDFKIMNKDVKEFIKDTRITYALGNGKRFYVKLRAGPNVERYIVETGSKETGFIKLGDAVRFFNDT